MCASCCSKAGNSLMAAYPDELRKATYDLLRSKNVEIMLNTRLTGLQRSAGHAGDGGMIHTHTLIWTAGVRSAEITDRLGVQQAAGDGSESSPLCSCPASRSLCHRRRGLSREREWSALPMLATVANSRQKPRNIRENPKGRKAAPFHYRDPGLLATIGRNAAVARIWGLSFSGFIAWVIWVVLHIYRLIGFRNRLLVLINWAWDYIFYENQVRLITKE
jgi:NADH:ubiquinone reductase (H+-translocating)